MIHFVLKFLKILTLVLFWILGLRINSAQTALNMFHFHRTSHSFHFFSYVRTTRISGRGLSCVCQGMYRLCVQGVACCSSDSHVWLRTFLKCEVLLNGNIGDRALKSVAEPQLESGELSYVAVGVRPTCGHSSWVVFVD